jgi:AraC-like DNA-binding protein
MSIVTHTDVLRRAEMVPWTWVALDVRAEDGSAFRAWVRSVREGVIQISAIAPAPLRPAEVAGLAVAALEVLATRLAPDLDDGHAVPPVVHRQSLLARIHAFIESHLGDPELSPAAVAAAHHISLRYLHKLFEPGSHGVAGMIRQRRLERCRDDLLDPGRVDRPVAAIAARWGFSSAAHFSRVFREAYGLPPAEFRRVHHLSEAS